jgi:endo-1,4-beta-xylanase
MKRNTYRLSSIIAVLLILAMVLGGCKGDTKKAEPVTDPAKTTEEAGEPTTAPEPAVTENAEGDAAAAKPTGYPMIAGTVDVKEEVVYEEDFEDGQTDFTGRGAAKAAIVTDKAGEGTGSLFVSGRTALWNGATVDLSKLMTVNENYIIKALVYYENGPDTVQIDCKVEKNNSEYLNFASTVAKKGEWTEMTGNIIIPEGTNNAEVYFETAFAGGELIDFYVDGISIVKEVATVDRGAIPALKDVYKDLYSVGVAATVSELTGSNRKDLIKQQFNSITPGNELKPDSVLDRMTSLTDPKYDESPAVKFDRVKPILDYAKENGLPVRGHTLVWHSQTPRWFFTVGYSDDPNAPLVTKELMLKRMENYIRQVIEYTDTNYPGLIYAWDVVNEAVNPSDGTEGGYRSKDSLWYQVIGPEFVEKAFEYARKYAKPDVKLFYNDYNTEDNSRVLAIYDLAKGLKEKGLIDGLGLQSHYKVDSPSLTDVEASMRKYGELGLELQITELDMGMEENTEEAYMRQAKRYRRLFTIYKNLEETGVVNITNVTFWGLSDDISWLSQPGKPSYPLLFDKYLLQKPAFWGVILSPDIPLY